MRIANVIAKELIETGTKLRLLLLEGGIVSESVVGTPPRCRKTKYCQVSTKTRALKARQTFCTFPEKNIFYIISPPSFLQIKFNLLKLFSLSIFVNTALPISVLYCHWSTLFTNTIRLLFQFPISLFLKT